MKSIFNNTDSLITNEPLIKQIGTRFTEKEYKHIKQHCKKIKVKQSDLVRHALKQYFSNLQNPKAHEQKEQQATAQ